VSFADEVKTALAPLLGLRWSLARYSGLTVFHFGTVRSIDGRGTMGEIALHIQCPWRIVTPNRIVTGSPDHWYPADETVDLSQWEKDHSTPSVQEKRVSDLFCGYDPDTGACENTTDKLVVEAVEADNYGGAELMLSGGYSLQLFPAATFDPDSEHWRLFRPATDGDHFVVKLNGVLERVGP
jgi:hypothetical protein